MSACLELGAAEAIARDAPKVAAKLPLSDSPEIQIFDEPLRSLSTFESTEPVWAQYLRDTPPVSKIRGDNAAGTMNSINTLLSKPTSIFVAAFLLRAVLLVYGIYQDSTSTLKYTDIDYYVFTDAARAVSRHSSPYDRATYRW